METTVHSSFLLSNKSYETLEHNFVSSNSASVDLYVCNELTSNFDSFCTTETWGPAIEMLSIHTYMKLKYQYEFNNYKAAMNAFWFIWYETWWLEFGAT